MGVWWKKPGFLSPSACLECRCEAYRHSSHSESMREPVMCWGWQSTKVGVSMWPRTACLRISGFRRKSLPYLFNLVLFGFSKRGATWTLMDTLIPDYNSRVMKMTPHISLCAHKQPEKYFCALGCPNKTQTGQPLLITRSPPRCCQWQMAINWHCVCAKLTCFCNLEFLWRNKKRFMAKALVPQWDLSALVMKTH